MSRVRKQFFHAAQCLRYGSFAITGKTAEETVLETAASKRAGSNGAYDLAAWMCSAMTSATFAE